MKLLNKLHMLSSGLEILIVWGTGNKLKFLNLGGFQTRNESMKKLINEAFHDKKNKKFPPIIINTGDKPLNRYFKSNIFSFSSAEGYHDKIIPDFIFDHWKQAKIPDYNIITDSIIKVGEKKPICNKIGRIGNFSTSPSRFILGNLGKEYPNYLDIKDSSNKETKWMSLEELIETYRYLIDVEGRGYSGRLKLLLFSGRPVFVQERKRQDFALILGKPGKDYILVKNDFSDLMKKLEDLEKNPEKINEIGKNGQDFAKTYLNKDFALEYIYTEFNKVKQTNFTILRILAILSIRFFQKIKGAINSIINNKITLIFIDKKNGKK